MVVVVVLAMGATRNLCHMAQCLSQSPLASALYLGIQEEEEEEEE